MFWTATWIQISFIPTLYMFNKNWLLFHLQQKFLNLLVLTITFLHDKWNFSQNKNCKILSHALTSTKSADTYYSCPSMLSLWFLPDNVTKPDVHYYEVIYVFNNLWYLFTYRKGIDDRYFEQNKDMLILFYVHLIFSLIMLLKAILHDFLKILKLPLCNRKW